MRETLAVACIVLLVVLLGAYLTAYLHGVVTENDTGLVALAHLGGGRT